MQLNHSELEYMYPTHLIPLANMFIEKVIHMSSGWFDCTEPSLGV